MNLLPVELEVDIFIHTKYRIASWSFKEKVHLEIFLHYLILLTQRPLLTILGSC